MGAIPHFLTLTKNLWQIKPQPRRAKVLLKNKPVNQAAPAGFAKLSVHHILVIFLGTQVLVSA